MKKKAKYRLIGDVHGKYDPYFHLCEKAEKVGMKTIQVGDLGFNYERVVDRLDSKIHRFLKGNHDNYDVNVPHQLGDYGLFDDRIFYVRGAFSIDWKERMLQNYGWWDKEELPRREWDKIIRTYMKYCPTYVISHTAPVVVAEKVGNPNALRAFGYDPDRFITKTSYLLQCLFEAHQPEMWFFGHFHVDKKIKIKDCLFVCLPELGYYDLEI